MKEKTHKPKVEIGPSSFFDDGPADPQLVTIASGCYCESLPVAGKTVAEIRQEFSELFDIDPASTAVIGGKDSAEDVVLTAGVTVMFMNRAGEKGASKIRPTRCYFCGQQMFYVGDAKHTPEVSVLIYGDDGSRSDLIAHQSCWNNFLAMAKKP